MELQKLGISYQFERSGQLPLDNSRKFNTYNDVKSWWQNVGNFYETQIISIGNVLYYFYSLPASAATALDANIETHLRKLIDDVDLAENKIDTTEIDTSTTNAINAAKDEINASIIELDTSLCIYAQNTDASIQNILDLIDGDTLGKIDSIEARIDSISSLLENTDLDLLGILDTSIKDLINVSTLHDTSIRLLNTSLYTYITDNNFEVSTLKYEVSTLKDEVSTNYANRIGRSGTGAGSEIFNDYVNNTASGNYSHAEGYKTKASGNYSFAGGYNSTATGNYSFVFGNDAKAEMEYGVAVGYKTQSIGRHAIAIGPQSNIQGEYAIGIGYLTATNNQGEIALGVNNYSSQDLTIFSIGNGDPMGSRKNVLTVTNNLQNNLFIYGIGGYTGMNPYANNNIKSVQQVINDIVDDNDAINRHINASYIEVSTYIHSSSYLTWNSSSAASSDTSALSQKGGHLLYTYITNVDSSLVDLSTNIYRRVITDENNLYNKIFEVSTNLQNAENRIDTSLIETNASVGKLEASTNTIERYISKSIDPSILYIKQHDTRIDSSVKIINTSIAENTYDISTLYWHKKHIDASIRIINTSTYNLDSSIRELQTAIENVEFSADDLHAVQYTAQNLSDRQKLQARINIGAGADGEYAEKLEEINILYSLMSNRVKHLLLTESEYSTIVNYDPMAVYMVVDNNSLPQTTAPPNSSIIENIDVLQGRNISTRITSVNSANYTLIGAGGTTIGTYKFLAVLNNGQRWSDYSIEPRIIEATITGEEVYRWQFGDNFPITFT